MPTLQTLFYLYLILAIIGVSFSIFSHLFGGADGEDVHVDAGHFEGEHSGFTFFNFLTLRNLFVFMAGFGAAGLIALNAGFTAWPSIGFGLLGGIVLAAIGILFFQAVAKQQGNSAPQLGNLVGKPASVVIGIPQSGSGEIQTTNEFGATVTLPARSQDGAIQHGAQVKVIAVVAGVATVAVVA